MDKVQIKHIPELWLRKSHKLSKDKLLKGLELIVKQKMTKIRLPNGLRADYVKIY